MTTSPDIIYFGGAFDPIHLGHMEAVKIAMAAFPSARVVLVPGFVMPASAEEIKSVATPFADRVAMAVVAFDEWPSVDVSSIEEELEAPNYTYRTLEALTAEHVGSSIAWMIGADQLASFPGWKNPKAILEVASLIVLPRPAMNPTELLGLSRQVASSLGFSSTVDCVHMRLDLDGAGSIYVMEHAPRSVSSTEVRKLAAGGLQKINGLVSPSVIDYIVDIGLYQ